jgi:effector-binding domain-containing protein
MLTEPKVEERAEQPYMGIRASVPMDGIAAFIDESFPKVFAHVASNGASPAGAPFVRFNLIDMDGELEMETCIPVADPLAGSDPIFAGTLPGGSYATLIHTGPYEALIEANEALQRWAEERGLEFSMEETPQGDRFDGRVEVYLTDPSETDPEKLETEVAYLLAAPRVGFDPPGIEW